MLRKPRWQLLKDQSRENRFCFTNTFSVHCILKTWKCEYFFLTIRIKTRKLFFLIVSLKLKNEKGEDTCYEY